MTLRIPIVVPVAYENAETKALKAMGKESNPDMWTFRDVTIYEISAIQDSVDHEDTPRIGFCELDIPGRTFIVKMVRYKLEQLIKEHR